VAVLKRGVIRTYDPSGHRAAVQIAGSLGTYLPGVPVATDVPPAEVQAGRECAVLFFAGDNPGDAVVVAVYGAVPQGGGPADHGALAGLGDDDHPQYGALGQDETVTGAWSFGSPGGSTLAVHTAPVSSDLLRVGDPGYGYDATFGLQVAMGTVLLPASGSVTGIGGYCLARGPNTSAYGLQFIAGNAGASAANLARAVHAGIFNSASTLALAYGLYIASPAKLSGAIGAYYAAYLGACTTGSASTRIGLYEAGTGAPGDAHGNRLRSNTQFGSTAGSFGGGDGVIGIANASAVPTANPVGGGVLFASGGALYWRGSGGTVTQIAPA